MLKIPNFTKFFYLLNLGTFIAEDKYGVHICQEIFSSFEKIDELILQLVKLCIDFGFDGWLINIENNIQVK